MNFMIMILITALLGALPLLLAKRALAYAVTAIIYGIFSWIVYYFTLPCLDYTLGGGVAAVTLGLMVISTIIVGIKAQWEIPKISYAPGVLTFLAIAVVVISGCGACNTAKYSGLIGNIDENKKSLKHWTQQNQELSPSHIRVVPQEHAVAIAKTSLNQHSDERGNIVGSQFPISESYATLQKVKDELYYVIPLDFKSWGVWNNTSGVPGFVLVNAEDQHAMPRYINGYKMKYTPGACFSENLERYLYQNGYATKILMDYSFEVDDELKPYWVVSVGHHTIGMAEGIVIDGVVIVEPESGKIEYYEKNKAPLWVDRIVPSAIVKSNLTNWGQYLNGFWNNTGIGASSNLRQPEATVLNYGADGTCWYVTPMTSISGKDDKGKEKDNSMTDLVYTNSRTGESHRYSVSGSTEEKILATVDATVKFQNLHGAAVVYENVSDRLTALVPILAEDHSIRGLALVDVATKSISWDPEPTSALMKYQNSLGSLGSALGTDIALSQAEFKDVVSRISQASISTGSIYYMYFKGKQHIYVVPQTYHEAVVTQPGDSVYIKYLDTEADFVSINGFDNLNLNIQRSKNQKDAIDRAEKRRTNEQKDASRNSAKATITNGELSDEALDSIAAKINKKKPFN